LSVVSVVAHGGSLTASGGHSSMPLLGILHHL
jgi:hypothetical protein